MLLGSWKAWGGWEAVSVGGGTWRAGPHWDVAEPREWHCVPSRPESHWKVLQCEFRTVPTTLGSRLLQITDFSWMWMDPSWFNPPLSRMRRIVWRLKPQSLALCSTPQKSRRPLSFNTTHYPFHALMSYLKMKLIKLYFWKWAFSLSVAVWMEMLVVMVHDWQCHLQDGF